MLISCSACGAENVEEGRFCNQCGTELTRACPHCDFANSGNAKFCAGCGKPWPSEANTANEPTGPVAERREVTVLFADMSGFTHMSTTQDPEETHAILNRYFAVADGAIDRYGGYIDKHIGDNVMGVFGAKVAHSNDPERAVRAALDIHNDISRLDIGISAHIGIASGTVLASGTGSAAYNEFTVTGETVNLASRLQDIAQSGETVISDKVRSAISQVVETSAAGEAQIKGFEKPVLIWTVNELRRVRENSGRKLLVGRKSELRQCAGIFSEMTQDAVNRIVFLRGEPGIGKSHLLAEIGDRARSNSHPVHALSFRDFGGGEEDILCDIARSVISPEKTPEQTEIYSIGAALNIPSGLMPCLFDLLRVPTPTEFNPIVSAMDLDAMRTGRLDCLARILQTEVPGPVRAVLIEDLHWANETALADLTALIRLPHLSGIVFVLTSRSDSDPLTGTWRGTLTGIPIIAIDLAPITREEAAELVAQMSDAASENIDFLIERAEGNPFFLEQLIRSVGDAVSTLPGSIQSVVLTRLDALEHVDKDAIQAASVFGTHFSIDSLRHVIFNPQYDCSTLTEAFLLRPENGAYAFAHALIRDGAYGTLPHSRARDLHLRAAVWFQNRDPVLYAEHLDRAGAENAADAYAEAAQFQMTSLRFESARILAERGALIAVNTSTRYNLLVLVGETHRTLGNPLASIDAFEKAKEIAPGDRETVIAEIGIAAGARLTGAAEKGFEAIDAAEHAAERIENAHALLAQIGYYRGALLFARGDRDGCITAQEMSFQNATAADDPTWTAHALSGLGDAHYAAGRMAEALDSFERCMVLCDEHDIGHIAVGSRFIAGNCRRYLNDFETAYNDATHSLELARVVRNKRVEMVSALICAEFEIDRNEVDKALGSLETSLGVCDELGNHRFRAYALGHVARAHHILGDHVEAVENARTAMEISRATGLQFVGPRSAAILALTLGDTLEARELLEEGADILQTGCIAHNHLWYWRDAIEWAIETVNLSLAESYADHLETCIEGTPLPWAKLLADRGRILADHLSGKENTEQVLRLRDKISNIGMHYAAKRLTEAVDSRAS